MQQSLEAIVKSIPEHDENMKKILEQESANVLDSWLQTEDALKQQLSGNNLQSDSSLINAAQNTDPD